MKLNEFRRRWVSSDTESSIDGSGTDGVDDWDWSIKNSTVRQPVRLRPKYVPEAGGDGRGRLRQVAVRVLAITVIFIVALVVLGAALDYLPAYMKTYVFDR